MPMVILFLVSNYNPIYLAGNETNKEKESRIKMFFVPMMCLIVLMLFCSLFFVAENIAQISEDVRERKMVKQEEVVKNPMILPSHAVHIAVKKFYLGKKFEEECDPICTIRLLFQWNCFRPPISIFR
jgi:Na+/H+ antiporter NhaD/arsenite permease-like protein